METTEARAKVRFVRSSPRKIRLVANLIRGKKVGDALNILTFSKKWSAATVKKLLQSAVANAQQKNLDLDSLFVKTIMVDGGPSLHRFMPRAMGRATKILKRTSHITVVVSGSATGSAKG